MLTNNLNDSANHIPLLSQEMERTLRLRAWRDENFREALIADPKGVIQQVFPHCFPDGKLPDDLTIKVIEEDPSTHHIVLPPIPDEEPILEIPEEQQVDLIANMGAFDSNRSRHSDQSNEAEGKNMPSFQQAEFKRNQARATSKEQGNASESFAKKDTKSLPVSGDRDSSRKYPTKEEFNTALSQAVHNKDIIQEFGRALSTDQDLTNAMKMLYENYLPDHKFPENFTFKASQNTVDPHYLVVPKPADTLEKPIVPKDELLDSIAKMPSESGDGCGVTGTNCSKGCQPERRSKYCLSITICH